MSDPSRGLLDSETENCTENGELVALNHGPEYKRAPNWELWPSQLKWAKERYDQGNILALFDALALCRRGNLPLPEWAYKGLMDFGAGALTGELPKKRGRAGSLFASHRDLLIHQERYLTVWSKYQFLQELKSADTALMHSSRLILRLKPNQTVKPTWLSAYALAAEELAGTFAQGNAEAMKDSYVKVAKWSRNDDPRAMHKATALPETYAALGFSSRRMGT